jgi:hypothetical protein
VQVPTAVLKAVVFVCYENMTTGATVPVGTGFFMGHDPKSGEKISPRVWAVTALHVIDGLRSKGVEQVVLRLNPKQDGQHLIIKRIPIGDWFSHPTDGSIDVSIAECGIPSEADHVALPRSFVANEQTFAENEVNVGDEVFVSGFFTHHFGDQRNIPIVRVGNLAALNDEKIATDKFGKIDGYLIEARSTGGLSGSPVYLNLGIVRKIGNTVRQYDGDGPSIHFLGLVHGHFVVKSQSDEIGEKDINAGIAIVISGASILAVTFEYDSVKPLAN